ncbi:MAG: homoserine kinase [Henriciella sp.]|nr:homoserine kinase [Henriciella sp.]
MAVYTTVSDDALNAFLSEYDIGQAVAFKGIAEGVENSNYYLETTEGRFILTLFEKRADPKDLPYFIGLKQYLAEQGFPCPRPVKAKDGLALRRLADRPAVIVSFLTGLSPKRPNPQQCKAMGIGLAQLHKAAEHFDMTRENALGPSSWPELWRECSASAEALQPGLSSLIEDDLRTLEQAGLDEANLPRGTIHADLFPDNAFFLGNTFAGAIDFYFACTDALAYDLAVCLNAWAFETSGEYNYSKGANLIAGYESVRKLEPTELELLPLLARGAAIRFFLTRLIDWTDTPADALVKPHDPMDYVQRLIFHRSARRAEDYGA